MPEGCTGNEPQECPNVRGFLFQKNDSVTWSEKGLFQLATTEENYLGLSGNGDWGYDTVTLGWQGDGGPTINSTLVAGIATTEFYLGAIGINNQPINFTTFNDPQPSLLRMLKDQQKIPSLSWSYTAGAAYQQPFGFGSLILGGYDTTRFDPNNLTIPFGPDTSRDLLVGIQSIRSSNSHAQLLPQPAFFWIDSTVSQMWLPLDACIAFEQAFGISWDTANSLYLVNDTLHDQLISQNPNITFTIGSELSGGPSVEIDFPYAAFDLNASLPLVNASSRYFPLQRATNESQYTLGRVFLQEAYVTADYERSTFQVQRAIFPDQSIAANLVAIQPENSTIPHSSKPNVGVEIGVILGGVVALLAVVAVTVVLCVCRRRKKQALVKLTRTASIPSLSDKHSSPPGIDPPSELHPFSKVELPVSTHLLHHELENHDTQLHELPEGDLHPAEMMASPVKDDHLHSFCSIRDQTDAGLVANQRANAPSQSYLFGLDRAVPVHELPGHVLVPELSRSTNTYSAKNGVKSPSTPALGSSPVKGGTFVFPRATIDQKQSSLSLGGWI